MKIASGVEWSAHACTLLAALPEGWALPADALAMYFDVPRAYLAKQMQALSRAGIVVSQRGASGGYKLAKAPGDISLWDITEAVEGAGPAFKCQEIRQNGPCGAEQADCKTPCGIAASFYAAENAFRDHLRGVSLTEMTLQAGEGIAADKARKIGEWVMQHASKA